LKPVYCVACTVTDEPVVFHLCRFLLSFEKRSVGTEDKKTSLSTVKAGVRSKLRRQILNGGSSRHSSVMKKQKVVKREPSPFQGLNFANSADDRDAVVDNELNSEFAADEKECSWTDEDLKTDNQQLDEALQPTTLVRYCF